MLYNLFRQKLKYTFILKLEYKWLFFYEKGNHFWIDKSKKINFFNFFFTFFLYKNMKFIYENQPFLTFLQEVNILFENFKKIFLIQSVRLAFFMIKWL